MSYIANNIKVLRKKLGLTQGALAERIDIKRSLIGAYEEGRAEPRLNNLVKLAEVLQTTVDDLIQLAQCSQSGCRVGFKSFISGRG